ncbi:unnamed protein product [Medioppia subpectinata]|uniref:Uncharacterized protein n=1 Tax=Medioppia subpectinata TaxID=1979941 RepID=A0A7R9KG07_9ACAR|nr:unnamed protein product [Medioppia subpectinata]CAG2102864.1 unnamed protein product [Medioppia subpectinata]
MNCSILAALIACLAVVHVAHGANINKRGLIPLIGNILDPLHIFHPRPQQLPPKQEEPIQYPSPVPVPVPAPVPVPVPAPVPQPPAPQPPTPRNGEAPATLKVDLDETLKADCKHPLSSEYKNTLSRLEVDADDFFLLDPYNNNPNHTEVLTGFTPFAKPTVNLTRWAKCEASDSGLTGLGEDIRNAPVDLTCNGYYTQRMTDLYEYNADFNGQKETIGLARSVQTMSFVNGNILEVHEGEITEGRCQGDILYIQTVYNNPNSLACTDYSLTSLQVKQMNVEITGQNCATTCSVDPSATNMVTMRPGYNNKGLAQ